MLRRVVDAQTGRVSADVVVGCDRVDRCVGAGVQVHDARYIMCCPTSIRCLPNESFNHRVVYWGLLTTNWRVIPVSRQHISMIVYRHPNMLEHSILGAH